MIKSIKAPLAKTMSIDLKNADSSKGLASSWPDTTNETFPMETNISPTNSLFLSRELHDNLTTIFTRGTIDGELPAEVSAQEYCDEDKSMTQDHSQDHSTPRGRASEEDYLNNSYKSLNYDRQKVKWSISLNQNDSSSDSSSSYIEPENQIFNPIACGTEKLQNYFSHYENNQRYDYPLDGKADGHYNSSSNSFIKAIKSDQEKGSSCTSPSNGPKTFSYTRSEEPYYSLATQSYSLNKIANFEPIDKTLMNAMNEGCIENSSANFEPFNQNNLVYSDIHKEDQKSINRKNIHIKKPLNAFMLFMKEMRSKVVSECTLKESAAINQILGRKWHALSRDEQARFYDMARKEKEIHQKLYPGWSARDNYATHAKKKKKRMRSSTKGDKPAEKINPSSQSTSSLGKDSMNETDASAYYLRNEESVKYLDPLQSWNSESTSLHSTNRSFYENSDLQSSYPQALHSNFTYSNWYQSQNCALRDSLETRGQNFCQNIQYNTSPMSDRQGSLDANSFLFKRANSEEDSFDQKTQSFISNCQKYFQNHPSFNHQQQQPEEAASSVGNGNEKFDQKITQTLNNFSYNQFPLSNIAQQQNQQADHFSLQSHVISSLMETTPMLSIDKTY